MKKLFLPLLLAIVPSAAHAEWYKATSDHFEVYGEGDRADIYTYAEKLERFDSAVRRLRNFKPDAIPGGNRVRVYLTPTRLFEQIKPKKAGGWYSPGASTSNIFVPEYTGSKWDESVIYHEYSHHLLMTAWSNLAVPGWLNEGLAQLQSTPETNGDGSVLFGRELRGSGWLLRGVEDAELKDMVTKSTAPTSNGIYYSGGWIVSHYLTFAPERQGQLVEYLVGVNKGLSTEEAAKAAFGDMARFASDVRKYRRGTSLPGVKIPASDINVGPIDIRPLTPGEEAVMELAIRSRRGVTEETAPGIYAEVKAAAAPYPADAGVQRVLAEAAYDADDFDAALAAAESAINADPGMADGYAFKAMAMDELGENADTIRTVIDEGLRADPGDPRLLKMYYESYLNAGQGSKALAKSRLIQAYRIAPQDPELRTVLGARLLLDGQATEARAVLRPLAFSPHRTGTAKRALEVVERIEAGDIEGARAAMSAPLEQDDEEAEGEEA